MSLTWKNIQSYLSIKRLSIENIIDIISPHCWTYVMKSNRESFTLGSHWNMSFSYTWQTLCLCYTLTHWGRVTHICVIKLTIIGSDNGLSPDRRQAIIWTNAGTLLIRPLWINFSEILIGMQTFSLKKMQLKMSSAKWRPFCFGLNELRRSVSGMGISEAMLLHAIIT